MNYKLNFNLQKASPRGVHTLFRYHCTKPGIVTWTQKMEVSHNQNCRFAHFGTWWNELLLWRSLYCSKNKYYNVTRLKKNKAWDTKHQPVRNKRNSLIQQAKRSIFLWTFKSSPDILMLQRMQLVIQNTHQKNLSAFSWYSRIVVVLYILPPKLLHFRNNKFIQKPQQEEKWEEGNKYFFIFKHK